MKKYILISLVLVLFVGCNNIQKLDSSNNIVSSQLQPEIRSESTKSENTLTQSNQPQAQEVPVQVNLKVPFISQAPLYNWNDLHNEACEEASVLNVILYLDKKTMDSNQADQELIKMVDWQMQNFGGHYDLPVAKVKELIKGYYNRDSEISYDVSIDSIKQELANGHPVIIPAAGRDLGNPNFKTPGPVYHMLVIRGYDDKKQEFITNDVGTRKGDGYRYKYQKLFDAIHDMPSWQQDKNILDANPEMIFQGRKAMLIID